MIRLLLTFFALACLAGQVPANAQSVYNDLQLPNPEQEKQAMALMETIRCVVCQGQAITGSNADLAADMRGMIRERIAAGEKPEDIRAWLIQNYGDWVSFAPQMGGRSAPLWLIPILALLIGGFLARSRFKKKVRN
ncbi:MAG: cytochrome c-type biogenesis protein [Sphingorhabdus sp.]